jgi:hypothetical protein
VVAAYEKITVPAGAFDAFRGEESRSGETARNIHWWEPALSASVEKSLLDWHDPSKIIVFGLASVRAAAK